MGVKEVMEVREMSTQLGFSVTSMTSKTSMTSDR